MKTIMLTSSNYIGNSQFRYDFRTPLRCPDEVSAVAISNIEFYNMSFNITSAYGNTTLTLAWRGKNCSIVFNDGYYSASDINSRIQAFCYLNLLYMTTSDGKIVYFLEVIENAPLYKIQLNIYTIPTAAQATSLGYSLPVGAVWTLPTTAETPTLTFNASFGKLIGQSAGTYPPTPQTTSYVHVSTFTPVFSPINSYIFSCSLINNPYGQLADHIATVALINGLGKIVQYFPPALIPHDIYGGIYYSMTITVYTQDYDLLPINDSDFNITVALLSPKEMKAMNK